MLAKGVVKSVQRGTAEHIVANTNSNFTIPINSIDLQRSILIANIEHLGNNAAPYTTAFVNNNGTAIVVKNSYGSSGITLSISWQVIEFY